MNDFERALKITLIHEGGLSVDSRDPGGVTNRGITQRTYDAWVIPHKDVRDITDDEVAEIYHAHYWTPAGCEALAWPLNSALFDFAVNSGVSRAVSKLQDILHVAPDGKFGPQTRKLAQERDAKKLAHDLNASRDNYFHAIVLSNSNLQVFLAGWLKRLSQLNKELGL